jgi:hypothetical protein
LVAVLEGGGEGMDMEVVPRPGSPLPAAEGKNSGVGVGDAPTLAEDKMAELMEKLNLTSEEASAVILEDENEEDLVSLEWAIIGKVLSPTILHI